MTERDALDALLDELSQQGQLAIAEPDGTPADAVIEPAYDNLADWATDWFLPTVERRVAEGSRGGVYWCAQWWAHPEGLQRIYALWREWERARIEEGMSGWWRDHLDPHLRSLTGEHGPFVQCSPARHYPPTHLPAAPLPADIVGELPEGASSGAIRAGFRDSSTGEREVRWQRQPGNQRGNGRSG